MLLLEDFSLAQAWRLDQEMGKRQQDQRALQSPFPQPGKPPAHNGRRRALPPQSQDMIQLPVSSQRYLGGSSSF